MKADRKDRIAERLGRSSVGIAGLGGLGSNAAVALARAGIGKLVLVDFDSVEKGNLNRQAYTLAQVGRLKTDSIRENIMAINPSVSLELHCKKLEVGNLEEPFKDVDVIVEALDEASVKAGFIEEILLKLPDKPLVAASGVAGYGGSERLQVRKTGKLYFIEDPDAMSSEEDVLLAPKVGLFAHWQANTVLEILLEGLDGH